MRAQWLDNGQSIKPGELERQGVPYEFIEPARDYMMKLDDWKRRRAYQAHDEVTLTPKTPQLDEILTQFIEEHLHTDDEVRYIVAGSGVFDIRSLDDRWMRVEVEAGDFIIVPANRYHRFMLTESKRIHAVRLFKENPSWEPVYRNA